MTDAMTLTPRQQAILDFVTSHIRQHGYPPTYAEIGRHFSISREGAGKHIAALRRLGKVTHKYGQQRTISLVTVCQPCDTTASC